MVGAEHHAGSPSRLGFFSEGLFAWFDDFDLTIDYEDAALVSHVAGHHRSLGLDVRLRDCVDHQWDVLVRELEVTDLSGRDREVRVFVHLDLDISESDVGDTAFYDPEVGAVIHYKGSRYFLLDGCDDDGWGVRSFTTGRAGFDGFAGSWVDAEDGVLSGHPIEQGAVDSCVGFRVRVAAHRTARLHAWLCAGTSYRDVVGLDAAVRAAHPARLVDRTRRFWQAWTAPAVPSVGVLPQRLQRLFTRSLLLARAFCDQRGGIVAATDRDILTHARDTYCYVWPRDGALVAAALDRAGFATPMRRFLQFCADRFGGGRGYLLHKFLPDGALGSSWHPWYGDGAPQLPIQEDETALVLWALGEHCRRTNDHEFAVPLYEPMVAKAADFMAAWRDPQTRLPLPSWDLWEERRGIHGFTVAAVAAGLRAAARLAVALGDGDKAAEWEATAAELADATAEHFWDAAAGRFARSLVVRPGGDLERDLTVDASLAGLFAFGLLPPDDSRVVATMEAVAEALWVRGGIGGIARYQNDRYQAVELRPDVPGNPWIICTLWLADWRARTAGDVAQLDATVLPLLEWVADRASAAALLPEQVHPFTGEPLSVSPLAWSHAAFVDSCLTYARARTGLGLAASTAGARPR